MPSNKKNQHPPKCVTRRLLENVPIQDLAQNFVCAPISKQFNGPGPSECGLCECEEDDSDPIGCCSLDRQYEETSRSRLRKNVESLPCEPECKPAELDTMINEIVSCRDFFRKLTLEAQDILEPRNSPQDSCCAQDPQYERDAQKQDKPSGTGWCCKHTDMEDNRIEPNTIPYNRTKRAKPMVHKSNSVGSKKQMCAPTTYSSLEDQSTSKLHAMPPTPPRSLSRNCSVPIAQAACKVKEGRLCKNTEEKLKNKADSKIEVTGGNTPEDKKKKNICKDLFQKVLGKKQSECSCDEEMRMRAAGISPDGEIKHNKDKKADCFCDENGMKGNKTADCFCDEKAMKGNKKADCFCDEKAMKGNKPKDCFCDEKAMKGNKPKDCFCDDEMDKQNKENERTARINSVAVTQSKAETACPCCFPPAYNQYFNCTGQVSGNCHCDKSV